MKTALTPSLEACLTALRNVRDCDKTTYPHLEGETKQAVDILCGMGLVKIVNGNPTVVEGV